MFRKRSTVIGVTFVVVLTLSWPGVVSAQNLGIPSDLSGDEEARGFADLLFANGMVLFASGDFSSALPLFEQAVRLQQDDATYLYFAAICKLRLGRLAESVHDLEAALPPASSRVAEARIRYDLGDAYYRQGDLAGASRELIRSTSLEAADAQTQFYLGITLFAHGETSEALGRFQRAIALDPDLGDDGAYYLGIAAWEAGDVQAARSHFERVLEAASDTNEVASSRQWLGYLDEAEAPGGVPRTDMRVDILAEHDDNPGQISDQIVVTDAGSDPRLVVKLRAGLYPVIDRSGWTVGLVFNNYNSKHNDFATGDMSGIQGVVHAAWGAEPLGYSTGPLGYTRVPTGKRRASLLFQAGSSYFSLDGNSFRRDTEVAGSVTIHHGFGKSQAELLYDDATYFDPFNRDFSGHETQFRLSQYFYFRGQPERSLRVGLGHSETSTRRAALDRDRDQVFAELALPLGKRWHLFLYASQKSDDYDDASANFFGISGRREDDITEVVAKLTLAVASRGFFTFRHGSYDREVDELGFFSHDRQISTVGYTLYW